jgi:ABC-type phosphate transport system substrate-binding protein
MDTQVIRLLDRMSIAVIRIYNKGFFEITPDDFIAPLSFTFGERIVWNARISEAKTDDLHESIFENMIFFGKKSGQAEPLDDKETADSRRERVIQMISKVLRPQPIATANPLGDTEPQYHGVQLNKVALKRNDKFKLVVVLHEPVEGDETSDEVEIDKRIAAYGQITNGTIDDEKDLPRVSRPKVAGTLAGLICVALIAVPFIHPPARDPAIECASGPLGIVGSTVFMPVFKPIADQYSRVCNDGPAINTEATGSKKGMLKLTGSNNHGPKPEELAVLYDGDYDEQSRKSNGLDQQPVAVIIYSIVVNQSVSSRGIKGLTTDEIRRIWSGEIKYWDELVKPKSASLDRLPIRIVSRGSESGSRAIFENFILKHPEESLTSDDCKNRKPGVPDTVAIRCECEENAQAIADISSTDGAIGYVDAPPTNLDRKNRRIVPVQLDDVYPDISNIQREREKGYPFWAVEYIYTKAAPKDGTPLKGFLKYLANGAGWQLIQSAGYTPCVDSNGSLHQLCT